MAISRMNMERQMRNMGGLMTLDEPRQGYFLGKIVRKAKKAVKKVVKSPLGKAAIIGGLGAYAGGLGPFSSGKFGAGFLRGTGSNLLTGLKSREGLLGQLGNVFRVGGGKEEDSPFSALRLLGGGLGAAAIAAPFLMGGDEEVIDEGVDFSGVQPMVANIRQQARDYYQDPTKSALYFMPPKSAVQSQFYAAGGGLADIPRGGYSSGQLVSPSSDGSRPGYAGPLDFLKNLKSGFGQIFSGEVGAQLGGDQEKINEFNVLKGYGIDLPEDTIKMIVDGYKKGLDISTISALAETDDKTVGDIITMLTANVEKKAYGGRIGKAEGGIMDLGGMEKDYREGGFVPLGAEERADDVPARLSKNEFVFTADAVRNAGEGDIDRGAEVMQNMMDNLEAGGTISEESQGEENPAQAMFDQAQMLEGRLA